MHLRLNPDYIRAGKTTACPIEYPAHDLYSTLEERADWTIEQAAKALEEAYAEIDRLSTLLAQKKE